MCKHGTGDAQAVTELNGLRPQANRGIAVIGGILKPIQAAARRKASAHGLTVGVWGAGENPLQVRIQT